MVNKICEECKMEFFYNPPVGYPDKRKYCSPCSTKKKADWDNKDKAPDPSLKESKAEYIASQQSETKPTETRDHKYDKDPVGLAVELFIAGMRVYEDKIGCMYSMDECIKLVKQPRKAFD